MKAIFVLKGWWHTS
ncbi:trp operon leader peptide [Shigella flexneri]|nr:trp operon leader peptide [Escherichia coli]EFH8473750.1 trp operon leader peptide [Escherichia coli]EFQ9140479.1 trp operon leader peptide [Escherichia coli]EIF7622826.1 trp operon leader peptide [Escherichia coli]EJN7458959.1 trp operon leader peptide [Escherichia coli]EKQ1940675.1 trp operon leader peptide [Escherichia coli]